MASLSLSDQILLLSFIIPTLALLLLRNRRPAKTLNLPPGPPGWPVVGNLLQAVRSGKPFYQYVDSLRKQYGPIFTLRMGTRTLIVLSDKDLVHRALVEAGPLFATRPRESPTRSIFSAGKFTVNAAPYGPLWRSLRKNMVQNMLGSGRLREFRPTRERAMDRLVEKLRSEAEQLCGGAGVWVLKNARFAVFAILVTMCFGLEMDESGLEEMDRVMKMVLITIDPRLDDFLPILGPFFWAQRRRASQVRRSQVELVSPLVERRRKALRSLSSGDASFSYLDTLFELRIEGRDSPPTEEELVTLCSEFINGGTDTTATAVEWAFARLISEPEVQERLYSEIQRVVGSSGRRVDENDVAGENMPYLEAFVRELLRKHPPTPLSLSHAVTTEGTELGGYDIPTDASVEIFFPGIMEDPGLWADPERFDPGRFLKEEGFVGRGGNDMRMLSFGVGRRVCPGMSMATMHIHLMVARMVQEFHWSAWPPGSEVDFSGKAEFTVVMKNPLRALIKPRVLVN